MKIEDATNWQNQKEALDNVEQIIKQWIVKRQWQQDLEHYENLRKQFMHS